MDNVNEMREDLKVLVDGCIAGKRKYQERFFRMYYGKMLSVCMRYFQDKDSAQEVAQEGFIKVFDKLASFDFTGSFDGWMRRIFANLCVDTIRRNKNVYFVEIEDYNTSSDDFEGIELDELLKSKELKAEVAMQAVQKLSPMYQSVFNLYVFENYSHKEIAEMLNISEGTSKSNLFKAKANLVKILEEEFRLIDNR